MPSKNPSPYREKCKNLLMDMEMTIIDKLRRHNPTIVVELFSKRTKDSLSNSIGLQEVSINDIDKFYIGGSTAKTFNSSVEKWDSNNWESIDKDTLIHFKSAGWSCNSYNFINEEIATLIERGIYNQTVKDCKEKYINLSWDENEFLQSYNNLCRTILLNIDPFSYLNNNVFLSEIISEKRPLSNDNMKNKTKNKFLQTIATRNEEEINPDFWIPYKNRNERSIKLALERQMNAASDTIQCGNCKGWKVTYTEAQTRSADESATKYYTCLICKKRWKSSQ